MRILVLLICLPLAILSCSKQDDQLELQPKKERVKKDVSGSYYVVSCDLPDGGCGAQCTTGQNSLCWRTTDCIGNDDVASTLEGHYTIEELNDMDSGTVFPSEVVNDLKENTEMPIN